MSTDNFIVLSVKATCLKISRSRAGVYAMLNPCHPSHDPSFPRPVKLGRRRVGFLAHEVDIWITERMRVRNLSGQSGAMSC